MKRNQSSVSMIARAFDATAEAFCSRGAGDGQIRGLGWEGWGYKTNTREVERFGEQVKIGRRERERERERLLNQVLTWYMVYIQ